MTVEPEWVLLSVFGSGFEADLIAEALEMEGILFIRTRPEAGIFGGGFSGPSINGVQILVASHDIERAKDIAASFSAPEATPE